VSVLEDLNIYRVSAAGLGAPERLIASTLRDQNPCYAPDGRIAFVSDRSGSREIWLANPDGSGQTRVTNLNGPAIGHLQWSPDGTRIGFDSAPNGRSTIFAIDIAGADRGEPKRLSSESSADAAPSWSADGKFIYFASERTGRWEVWRRPALGGPAVQITRNRGFVSRASPDHEWVYFAGAPKQGIWRIRLATSGDDMASGEELVIGPPYHVQSDGWTLAGNEIIFLDRASGTRTAAIRAYNVSTHAVRLISSLRELFSDRDDITVSVSPDRKWILYSQLDRSGSNIFVADRTR
jgi:Tol biopolymer transport system component